MYKRYFFKTIKEIRLKQQKLKLKDQGITPAIALA
jgi:uncharacterized protein YdcH (DUF465 family)